MQTAAGVTLVIGVGGYLWAVTQGAALLFSQLTPLSYTQGLLVAWASYTFFTMYSGSRGVVITDTLMFGLFATVSIAAVLYIVGAEGGWRTVFEQLIALPEKPDLMSWHGMVGPGKRWLTPADLLTWSLIMGVAWSFVVAISPWQSSRYLMAKSEHVVLRSACFSALAIVLIQRLLYASAATINLSNSGIDPPEQSMIWAALNLLPPLLGALMLAGVMAAALSSATTFLSLVGFTVSNDIAPRRGATDRTMLRYSRLMMLAVGVATLAISLLAPMALWDITMFVGPVFASSWGVVAFMSVWSDRITSKAAFWGIVSGFLGNVIPKIMEVRGWIYLPTYLDPIVLGGLVSLVVVLALCNRAAVTSHEREYRLSLHRTPPEETEASQVRATKRTAVLLAGFGLVVTLVFIAVYVAPYQELTGTLREGGGLDWTTGEMWHALGWVLLLGAVGGLAYRVVRRSYEPGP